MANTNINKLPIVNITEQTAGAWYLYAADVSSLRDARIKVSSLFSKLKITNVGTSLVSSDYKKIKGISVSSPLGLNGTRDDIKIYLQENLINLSNCDNTTSNFMTTVDLGADVGTSLLSIVNGGTGASEQANALNLLTNSASGSNTKILQTDGTGASWKWINELFTASVGLEWDTTVVPYKLKVDLSDATFTSDILFNNHISVNGYNIGLGDGWLSNDKGSEGISINAEGHVFMGYSSPTRIFDTGNTAALTLNNNLSFASGSTKSINLISPISGGGDEFKINGSAPTASNQAGGAITLTGGAGTGSGVGGAINLLAGNSASGDGDINLSVCDGGTVSQVFRAHGSNKHFTFGSTGANNNAVVDIQNDTTSAACLELDQNDTDEPFVIYTGTTAADDSASLSSLHGTFPNHTNANDGWVRISINGTDKWVPFFATPA